MTIFGWDASNWDYGRGPVDVAAAVRDGISFVTAKATEGTSFTDPGYSRTAARARGVAPLSGAYHVLHPAGISSISGQVSHFLSVLDGQSPWWRGGPFIVQLDCERWAADDFPQRADIAAWCDQFTARTGNLWTPIVYASHGQYGDSLSGLNRPLWNANYGNDPVAHYRAAYPGDNAPGWAPYSGRTPILLQYGSQLTIGGQSGCDANAFRGPLSNLVALAYRGAATAQNGEDMPAAFHASVPAGFSFTLDAAGHVVEIPGTDTNRLVLGLPASVKESMPWGTELLTVTSDVFGRTPVRLRVAIHNGFGWGVYDNVIVPSGGRRDLPLPAPYNGAAYTVSIGRVRQSPDDDSAAQPVAVLAELGVR
jgi:Glycosyl hydrolases family 25